MRYTFISLVATFGLIVNALAGHTGGRVRRNIEDDLSEIKDAVLKIDHHVKMFSSCMRCHQNSHIRLLDKNATNGLSVNALVSKRGERVRRDIEDDLSEIKDGVASLTDGVASLTDAVLKIDRQVKFLDSCMQCRPDSRVRLVGGSKTYGRVQVKLNGEWGAVCDDVKEDSAGPGSGSNLAVVVCRSLGLHGGEYIKDSISSSLDYPDVHIPFLMDDVECDGTETTIFECKSKPDVEGNCSYNTEDIIVRCRP